MPDLAGWQWVIVFAAAAFSWGFVSEAGSDLFDYLFSLHEGTNEE